MMRKSVGHKDKYSNKREISQNHSNDGTAARTRPISFDEIMLRRKTKKQSGSGDQQGGSEVVSGKGAERVESDRHRRKDSGGGREEHASKESLKVSSRLKEDKAKMREEKIVEGEYRERNNVQVRSKVGSDDAKDRKKERDVREKRKNHNRSSEDSDNEYRKRHSKDSAVKDRDRNVERNREKSEHASKRRNQNGNDERGRDKEAEKKHESRKLHDSNTSERKQRKGTSESRHEDLKLRKRSRSREHDRDKRRSKSPSPRRHKQRQYDVQEHEEPSLHSSKDRPGIFDSNNDRKRVSNNDSSNKSKRHDASASRLGGYSPRKRRSEAAVKTPSPTSRSPEKKKAGWDSSPVKMEGKFHTSVQSDLPSLNKTELSNRHEVANMVPLTSNIPRPNFGILSNFPLMMNASVDSVQLTQATRPKRRIYVENLPSSASEAVIMEWLTGYLRPSAVNLVQGTSPCISCIVNKEKGQALVEFLTPEDASTALTLDGRSFLGNILKIRRPKDYVEAAVRPTGVSEKPVAGAVSVKNIVDDSPNKIFIGGISKVITSEMLMEIASAFGPLRAFQFEDNADLDSPCAFIEYVDQSVTIKACVGLNGMKLGGKVLTVTQATPNASSVVNHGDQPIYGTPVHAQPLLKKPTKVLKLNNLLDPHSLSSLSEPELEEILEDVRLECARFGLIKSINMVKQADKPTSSETVKVTEEVGSMEDEAINDQSRESGSDPSEQVEEPAHGHNFQDDKQDLSSPIGGTSEHEEANVNAGANGIVDDKHENVVIMKDETCDTAMVETIIENQNLEEKSNQIGSGLDQLELNDSKPTDDTMDENISPNPAAESHDDITEDKPYDLCDLFEAGCVLVEYKRTEASTMAAHCLHGRVFDGRIVSIEYVEHDVYRTRFHPTQA